MRVRDVMTRRVRSLREDDTTELATAVLLFWRFRHLPVLDSENYVAGILTPTDLLDAARRGGKPRRFTVSELMRPVVTIHEDDSLDTATERMRQQGFHALPVVGADDRLVGIVTDVDVLIGLTGARPILRPLEQTSVDAVMTRRPETVEPDTSLEDAAEALLQGGFRHLPVLDGERRLVGMLSERDLRTHLGAEVEGFSEATLDALTQPVSEAMTPDPISVRSGTPLAEALETFASERVGALPVVDDADRLLGILSYVDLLMWLREGARRAPGPPRARTSRSDTARGCGPCGTATRAPRPDGRGASPERRASRHA
jgi:CBS domain-containing protein